MAKTHHEINFSPFATNVLDWVNKPGLVTPDGTPVTLTRDNCEREFVIRIGEREVGRTEENVHASYILNYNQVGTQY